MDTGPFLTRLAPESLARLRHAWTRRRCRRGETVLMARADDTDVYFVLEGRARASIVSDEGRSVSFKDFAAGDIFGEFAAIDGRPRTADVIAVSDLSVACLPAARLRSMAEEDGAFAWTLLQHVIGTTREMNMRIYEFSTMLVRERLLRELLRLAETGNAANETVRIAPAPTHQDLAARISTHREAVSREMSRLAKMGLVARERGALVIRDLDGLRRLDPGAPREAPGAL